MSDRRYYIILFLLIIVPYQNSLNLFVGFSIKPLTYGVPFLLCLSIIIKRISSLPRGNRFILPIEKFSILDLIIAFIFLPMSIFISFTGAVTGFLAQYLGVFSFFIFKDLWIDNKKKNILILAMLVPLFLSVVYGIYEYLFAKYELIDWLVANSSNSFVEKDVSEGYKRMFALGDVFYRSQSFELAFLSFGYQGFFLSTLLLGILLLCDAPRGRIWIALAALLSVIGMVSSVTFSAVGMFVAGCCYFLFHLRGFKWIKSFLLLSVLMLSVLVALLVTIPEVRSTLELGLEFISAEDKLAAHTKESKFEQGDVLNNFIIGRGTATSSTSQRWFPKELFIEHQYYATIAERGIIGLATYLLFMFSIYSHLRTTKKRLRYGTLDYAMVVSLIWVWVFYVVVGFIHYSWGTNIDFMFMGLVGLISNRYAIDCHSSRATVPQKRNLVTNQGISDG